MSVKFFWCHTDGCPNYGRPRKLDSIVLEADCAYCGQQLKVAAPGELPSVVHEVDEENQIKLTEDDLSEG